MRKVLPHITERDVVKQPTEYAAGYMEAARMAQRLGYDVVVEVQEPYRGGFTLTAADLDAFWARLARG